MYCNICRRLNPGDARFCCYCGCAFDVAELPARQHPHVHPSAPVSTPVAPLESVVGKTCPFCQTPLKPHDLVITCRSCQMPHHEECWQENGGCTTFGCTTDEGETQPLRPSPVMAAMPQTLTIELADLDDGTPQRDEETVGSSCGATVIRVFLTAVIILLVVPLVIWMLWAAFAILFQ